MTRKRLEEKKMMHLDLAKQLLELSPMELSEILMQLERSNPGVIDELKDILFLK